MDLKANNHEGLANHKKINKIPSSGLLETRFKIIEDFFDFREIGGLTLPYDYKIHYLVSGQNGTTEIEWDFEFTDFLFNQIFPDSTFDAEAFK